MWKQKKDNITLHFKKIIVKLKGYNEVKMTLLEVIGLKALLFVGHRQWFPSIKCNLCIL